MTKARRSKLPADERRCKLNSGKGWRCTLSRFRNYTVCKKHHDYIQQRNADARAKRQEMKKMKKMKPDLEVNNVGVQDGKLNLIKRPGRPKKMKPDLEVNNVGVQDGKLNLIKRPGRPKKMKPDLKVNSVGVRDGKLNLSKRPERPKKMKPDLKVNSVGVQDGKLNLNKRSRRPKKTKTNLKVNSVGVQDGKLNLNKRSTRPKKTKTNLEGVKVEETKRPTKRKRVTRPKQEDIVEGQTSNTSSRNKKKKKKRVSPKKKAESIEEKHNADEGVVRVMELGQIWAFSDETDGGFPCSYARIDRIIPIPSQVEVTPLIPQLVSEEERQFAEHGLSLAHGTFKASESTIVKDIQSFTHKATFEELGRCSYKIFPRIGEIWAVHWDSNVSRRGYRQFKLVEVVSDFSEEQGVNVFGLVQVEGLSGVYQRQLHEGFYMIRCFSRKFMPMFSHQVPATKIEEGVEMRWKVMFH